MERAVLDENELSELEEQLDLVKARLAPGAYRGGPPAPGRGEPLGMTPRNGAGVVAGEAENLDEVKADILETARRGINVAPYIESRPLISLFHKAGVPLPPEIQVDHEEMGFDFYVAEASFSVLLEDGIKLQSARFSLDLSDDVTTPGRGVRPIRIFPGRKDVTLFAFDGAGSVGIDASMNLRVPEVLPALGVGELAATAEGKLKGNIVVGPFEVAFRRAALEVKGDSDPSVSWHYRLNRELDGKNDFKSILILKIAREARSVAAVATLQVVPFKPRWFLFKDVLPALGRKRTIPIPLAAKADP